MSAEGKILAAEFTAAVLVIGGYIIYSGSRDGIQPSVANLPDRDDGRPALAEENYSGAVSPTTPVENSSNTSNNSQTKSCEPTPPGYITNPETCAYYKLVPDPRDPTKLCAEKGSYILTPEEVNKRTLWGLRWTVGEGLSREVEMIDPETKLVIGYFPVGVPATFDMMIEPASNDTLACLVYPDVE